MSRIKLWITRSFILSVAPIVEQASRFGRIVILSRLLTPDEFGTSAAIGVLVGLVALVTDVSLDKFVVQSSQNDARTLAAAHTLSVARGIIVAVGLFVTAPIAATLFGVPHATGGFAAVALYPFIVSLSHLGIKQVQRNFDYRRETIAQLAAHLSAFLTVIPAAYFFQDYRAVVASYLMESGIYAVASHYLLAEVPYRLRSDRKTLRAALEYGLPLMVNGIGLAALAQLDRLLVGSWLGVGALANYTVMLTLGILPMGLVLRVFGPMAFSSVLLQRRNPEREDRQALFFFLSAVISSSYAFYVALSLDWLTPLIFGQSFHVPHSAHILLVMIVFLRLLRFSAPTIFLLASERTGKLAILNLSAGGGIACSFFLIQYWLNITSVLFGTLVGEAISFVLFFGVTYAKVPARRYLLLADIAMSFFSLAVIVIGLLWYSQFSWQTRGIVFIAGLMAICAQVAVGFYTHKISSLILEGGIKRRT